jgi:hypothetical protein
MVLVMARSAAVGLSLLLSAFCSLVHAQVCADYTLRSHFVNSTPLANPRFNAIEVVGARAYAVATVEYYGLGSYFHIFDVTDPIVLNPMSNLSNRTGGSDLEVRGDLVYIVGEGKLIIVNVSDEMNPVEVGVLSLGDVSHSLSLVGEMAFIALLNSGQLAVVDVQVPATPVKVGSLVLGAPANCVLAIENHAYVGLSNGLSVVEVSDPANPVLLGNYPPGPIKGLAREGNYLIAGFSEAYRKLSVIDISDPDSPLQIGKFQGSHEYRGVAVAGTTAFAAASDGQYTWVDIFDISDPTQPIFAMTTNVRGGRYPGSLGVGDGVVYSANDQTADGCVEVLALKQHEFTEQTPSSSITTSGALKAMRVHGNLAYLASSTFPGPGRALALYDVSDPSQPLLVGSGLSPGAAPGAVDGDGSSAFIVGYQLLESFDISAPPTFSVVESLPVPNLNPSAMQLSGSYVHVVDLFSGLHVFDVSDPVHMVEVGQHQTAGGAYRDLYVENGYAYLARDDKLEIVDVTVPTNPSLVYAVPYAVSRVLVTAGRAYTQYYSWVGILDVSNPTAPVLLGEQELPAWCQNIAIDGDLLYASSVLEGVSLVDITDPVDMEIVGMFSPPPNPITNSIHVASNSLITFCKNCEGNPPVALVFPRPCGLVSAIDQTPGASTVTIEAFPNPFNPDVEIRLQVPKAGRVSVSVFDVSGRRVAGIHDGHLVAGEHRFRWTGSNDHGEAAASGTYFVRVDAGSRAQTTKVTLLK